MTETQTGNTQSESPDVDIMNLEDSQVGTSPESQAFFDALDQQTNGAIFDDNQTQTTSEEPLDNNRSSSPAEGAEINTSNNTDAENLQQRYSASSREAKRLNGRLSELEPYLPILDAMKEDPNLITHVRNYFEGGGNAPNSMKEQLKIDEDFIFDGNDAFDNPNSDSARVLNATIDGLVQRRLSDYSRKQQSENQQLASESDFRSRHEMDQNQWEDLVSFAKEKKLDLDDIYYLKNRQSRDKNIHRNAQQEVANQVRSTQARPQSLASTGGAPQEDQSPEDSVFDQLLGGENLTRLLG